MTYILQCRVQECLPVWLLPSVVMPDDNRCDSTQSLRSLEHKPVLCPRREQHLLTVIERMPLRPAFLATQVEKHLGRSARPAPPASNHTDQVNIGVKRVVVCKHSDASLSGEQNDIVNVPLDTFYIWLHGVRHIVKDQRARQGTCCCHFVGYSFQFAAWDFLYAPSNIQYRAYHG